MANNRESSRAYLVVELWSSSEAIIFFIVEGIEYEGISELLWGKNLIWGEAILFYPSLAPTLTSPEICFWNINNKV